MREIYSNEINELDYNISIKGVPQEPSSLPTAKLFVGADKNNFPEVGNDLTVSLVDEGHYKVIVPLVLVAKKKLAKVVFTYSLPGHGVQSESEIYEVTQRLVTFDEYKYYVGKDAKGDSFAKSYDEYNRAEKLTRQIVESFCNQKFNVWQGTRQVYAANGAIYLPQHIEKVDSISGGPVSELEIDEFESLYRPSESGLFLTRHTSWKKPTAIYRPDPTNSTLTITGLWGYETVPSDVKEAVHEIMRFYMSNDMEKRRMYMLNANNSEGDSMSFNFGAYRDSTGNPVADELLSNYRIYAIGAI